MKRAELNFAQKVWLESLWLGARFFAVLPYWFKYYVVENLLFFILYYCLRYRMKVVNENLRNSFPEKSVGELAVIRRNFYRTLAEIFVDTVNMAHMGEEKARTVLTVKGFDEHYKAVPISAVGSIVPTGGFTNARRCWWRCIIPCAARSWSGFTSVCATMKIR